MTVSINCVHPIVNFQFAGVQSCSLLLVFTVAVDCLNYIKNISRQKVTSERIFLHIKKKDESISQEEIKKRLLF